METIKKLANEMLTEEQSILSTWRDSRDNLPFPNFSVGTSNDKAWMAGLEEGKAAGKVAVLKEILNKLQ